MSILLEESRKFCARIVEFQALPCVADLRTFDVYGELVWDSLLISYISQILFLKISL